MNGNRDEPDRRKRLIRTQKIQKMIGASYLLDAGVLALYAAIEEISWLLVMAYLLCGITHVAGFTTAIFLKVHSRSADNHLVAWQLIFAATVQLSFVVVAPEIGVMFMLLLFVVFGFSALIQPLRQCAVTWLLTVAVLAVQIGYFGIQPSLPLDTFALQWVFWLIFAATLGRVMLLGAFARSFRVRLDRNNRELSAALVENHRLATTDDLTGALNRRSLMGILSQEVERAVRYKLPLCVAMLDLDNFKQVNDRFGHLVGDTVLKRFSLLAHESLRVSDCFGRFGGEEFFVILPHCTESNAVKIMERYRMAVQEYAWPEIVPDLSVSVSIGVAVFKPGGSIDLLLSQADAALYDAKHSGRNQTCRFSDGVRIES